MIRTAVARALTPRGATTVSRHDAACPEAGRCRQPRANNNPTREISLSPGFSRQYGAIGPWRHDVAVKHEIARGIDVGASKKNTVSPSMGCGASLQAVTRSALFPQKKLVIVHPLKMLLLVMGLRAQ
ncbi:hypothetical protein TcG_11442 [Trypanosoma cruzi]|nr:hypothetical protein TcG_11442 [Trypanosoma cruzi]